MNSSEKRGIARDFIRSKRPCSNGYRGYQRLPDDLVLDGRVADACWLLDLQGPTDDVLTGGGGLRAGRHLQCGWGMLAGEDIVAEGAIRAGETLQAGGVIESGPDYGVFAGLVTPMDAWEQCAFVRASAKPARLISGCWGGA